MRPCPIGSTRPRSIPTRHGWRRTLVSILIAAICCPSHAIPPVENDASVFPLIKGEQRRIRYRDPAALPDVYVPPTEAPPTVRDPLPPGAVRQLALDEAIGIALANSDVVRQLAGVVAVSSGRTIYDPAITNTTIDQQRAAFDPTITVNNTFNRDELPFSARVPIDPADPDGPQQTIITGVRTQTHDVRASIAQRNLLGGTAEALTGNLAARATPGFGVALNPQDRYDAALAYTQPLLRGAGVMANRVPIVLARIDTERSFFQLRDSLQELVRSVIDAYWQVVFARTDVWAREIQVKQAEEAFNRAQARVPELADITEESQARAALAQFRANLIASRANLLSREAALAGILRLPVTERVALEPITPPTSDQILFDWNQVTEVAQIRRPDLIELKLILEADQQNLILARNERQPNLDLVGLYRWNGLDGTTPEGFPLSTNGGESTDWTVGVNFSVPLILRAERAGVRSAELLITRDRAALEQGVLTARQILANNFRNIDQFYAQYEAFTAAREASKVNLERQFAYYETGADVFFLNVLQAISDWGNSVSLQAQSLTQYNIELANLERETGTILETHGVFMYEDRFCSLGPIWINPHNGRPYPRDIRPGPNAERYPAGDEPAEQFFDLDDYPQRLPPTDEGPSYPMPELLPEMLPEVLPPIDDALPPIPTPPAATTPQLEFPPSLRAAPDPP
jgi:outer membrane protein TolC